MENQEERVCCICYEPIQGGHVADDFKANYKLLSLFDQKGTNNKSYNNQTGMPPSFQPGDSADCPRHPDQIISYFCKACNLAVCVDCMYD